MPHCTSFRVVSANWGSAVTAVKPSVSSVLIHFNEWVPVPASKNLPLSCTPCSKCSNKEDSTAVYLHSEHHSFIAETVRLRV